MDEAENQINDLEHKDAKKKKTTTKNKKPVRTTRRKKNPRKTMIM